LRIGDPEPVAEGVTVPMGYDRKREALVGMMYDAVLDGSLWSTVLEGIADLTGSAAALIHGYSVDREIYTFHELGRIDPDCKRPPRTLSCRQSVDAREPVSGRPRRALR
jgi:hypothetical protein